MERRASQSLFAPCLALLLAGGGLAGCAHDDTIMPAATAAATTPASTADFTEDGYRARRFRAPITRSPDPAQQISLATALTMEPGRDALFIDVLPVETGVRDSETGIWRISSQHSSIPGALWHPETGRAPPDPVLWHGLEQAISDARTGRPKLPVVLFCRTDCWMGWNAARRLAREGVGNVYWLAEGVEGWHDAGRDLTPAMPETIAPVSGGKQ